MPRALLHVLFSPRAEGCPRLALDFIAQEREQLGTHSAVAFCVSEPPDLTDKFRSLAGSVQFLDWRRRAFMMLFYRFFRLLGSERPRGVICYTLGLHVPLAAAASLLGVPFVVHIGNAPPAEPLARRKLRLQLQAGRPFVTMHAACSDYIADRCKVAYGLPGRVIASVPNGIDLDRYLRLRAGRTERGADAPLRIGMVASLESHKDHPTLLRGFAALSARGVIARLQIVGDGSRRRELQMLAKQLGIDNLVEWKGAADTICHDLVALDVFAFATTEQEGLGIALVEALAAGLPVVASDVGACREVLANGRWGRLVQGSDPETWADALAGAMDAAVPEPGELSRYDVKETYRAYARLLGDAA